jgi:hypothetical protein
MPRTKKKFDEKLFIMEQLTQSDNCIYKFTQMTKCNALQCITIQRNAKQRNAINQQKIVNQYLMSWPVVWTSLCHSFLSGHGVPFVQVLCSSPEHRRTTRTGHVAGPWCATPAAWPHRGQGQSSWPFEEEQGQSERVRIEEITHAGIVR